MSNISVIIAAAGSASRLSLNQSKQFLKINGKPLLHFSIEKFLNIEDLDQIVIVTNDIEETESLISVFKNKISIKISAVLGGELRQESVYKGFLSLSSKTDLVIIHDVGRPLFETSDLKKCIDLAKITEAAIICVPVVDTIKKGKYNNDELVVDKTIERDSLFQIQTPQVFSFKLLKKVYENYNFSETTATDEAKILETMGKPVSLVIGNRKNIKITYPEDIEIAESLLIKQSQFDKIK